MSYRGFKHLLGETSLERKCRFIFGGGIFFLVSTSFYIYGRMTEGLVVDQNRQAARLQVNPILLNLHNSSIAMRFEKPIVDALNHDLAPDDGLRTSESRALKPHAKDAAGKPADDFEAAAVADFLRAATSPGAIRRVQTFPDGTPMERARIVRNAAGKSEYQYVQAVLFKPGCVVCHEHASREDARGYFEDLRAGDLAGAVVVKLSMDQTNKAINRNRALLISAALITALLAIAASYVIVRYVIVKPVKHLRDVSDTIASGKLNVRSKIQTGDEFEELSHAFNRMLHNLVAMQSELREVNGDLDKKVDELAQANMALFEMNRLKSDFLATMSHELRTPLNSIIGFSEVLAGMDQLNERQRRYAANIQTSGKMLLGMINDILDLAKLESGKMEVRVEDFSIRDVCEGLVNLARPIADRKDIDLECRLDEAIPLLRQDPGKLRQIVYNLLSNALKFTPEGGRVTLSALHEGRSVVVSVEDTGIGIAEEDRDRIFEKFRQAGAAGGGILTREHEGTGLGLSIVRELSKLLGGDVSLESTPGQGSTFTVRVPLQLPGNRRFEVNLGDERVDLSKARRVEGRSAAPRAALVDAAAARRPEPGRG